MAEDVRLVAEHKPAGLLVSLIRKLHGRRLGGVIVERYGVKLGEAVLGFDEPIPAQFRFKAAANGIAIAGRIAQALGKAIVRFRVGREGVGERRRINQVTEPAARRTRSRSSSSLPCGSSRYR